MYVKQLCHKILIHLVDMNSLTFLKKKICCHMDDKTYFLKKKNNAVIWMIKLMGKADPEICLLQRV